MSLLNILKTVMKNNLNKDQDNPVLTTQTPLGAHQGSVVTLPEIDFALAEADGSICVPPSGTLVVTAVGKYILFGLDVYHCYFGYEGAFLQLVTKANNMNVEQARYFHLRSEIQPRNSQEWEFWLGSWQKNDQGEFLRDGNGIAIKLEEGLIGFPQFQVDTNPPLIYDREWQPGAGSVNPVKITEKVLDVSGQTHYIKREAMEYSRSLSDNDPTKVESLLACVVEDNNSASVNIFIGIQLEHAAIKVLSS